MSYLKGSLCYAVHRARLSVMADVLEAFADQKITLIEFLFLMVVAENPGISQADLADALGVERPRIVPTLNKMEKRGLATRTVLATDSRFRQIQLTKSGQHMVRVLQKRLQEIQNTMMAQLDAREARTILSALWKLADKRPASTKQPVRPTRKSKPLRPFENAPKRWMPGY
jgi:DNA-binding MarR family transcriptional regulator